MLQQAIRETASGGAEIDREFPGGIDIKVGERMLEFVAAAADEFFGGVQRKFIIGGNGIAGLSRGLLIDAHLPGHNGALGLFATGAKAALDEFLVQPFHRAGGKIA